MGPQNGRKVLCFSNDFCRSGGSKSRLATAAGVSLHAAVKRSTFSTQNAQNTPAPDNFWQLGSEKMARRCGAKQVFNSKSTKKNHHVRTTVRMSKNREARLQVKVLKTKSGFRSNC